MRRVSCDIALIQLIYEMVQTTRNSLLVMSPTKVAKPMKTVGMNYLNKYFI